MKIATVVGARPQFIKAAAMSRALKKCGIEESLIHTGQHYDDRMSRIFFDEMEIPAPAHNLGIGGLSHGAMTGRMMEKIEEVLESEKPDMLLVFGDTNSTLAGALAAVKLHIPVAHVEAGLRSFNRNMPEEINRILTDQCSTLLFTPSNISTKQLIAEGIGQDKIVEVGDVMYDAALYYYPKAMEKYPEWEKKNYALATVHREENVCDPQKLSSIFEGLLDIAQKISVVVPIHPRTKQALEKIGLLSRVEDKLTMIDPVGYLEMIALESNAQVILTDSGGVQKEAFYFQVPCLTLRNETEWVELCEEGYNRLVPQERNAIYKAFQDALTTPLSWKKNLYGNGQATEKIAQTLLN